MNNIEFSAGFDTLLDSYKIKNEFGDAENIFLIKLDEYEKSLYLTHAQEDLIIDLYTGRNYSGFSYEETEELRSYLSSLNTNVSITQFSERLGIGDGRSLFATKPIDLLWITLEKCRIISSDPCINNTWIDTIPIKKDSYNVQKNNPFKNKKIWRVEYADVLELIPNGYFVSEYFISYLKKPRPIVLDDLVDLSIDGISTNSECELNPILHREILRRAVQNAVAYMATQLNNNQ